MESALAQTNGDFEVLLVDDGSVDDTAVIARRYAAQDPRIRFVRNEKNWCWSVTGTGAVELARGKWIKFLFQDDLLAPECLEKMLAAGRGGKRLVFCEREFILGDTLDTETRAFYQGLPTLGPLFRHGPEVDAATVIAVVLAEPRNFFGEPTSCLLHRTLFARFGLFNPCLVQICDLEYWIRVGIHTGMAFVPEKLASFRCHPASTSALNRGAGQFRSRHLDRLILLHEFVENDRFAPLRAAAARADPPRNLSSELARMSFSLKTSAQRAASQELIPTLHLLRRGRKWHRNSRSSIAPLRTCR